MRARKEKMTKSIAGAWLKRAPSVMWVVYYDGGWAAFGKRKDAVYWAESGVVYPFVQRLPEVTSRPKGRKSK
jgi:hypothetical protein